MSITRRLFLRNSAAAGAIGVTIAAPVVAEAAAGDPDERIAAAIAEIHIALGEKYPGWRVQVQNTAQRVKQPGPNGTLIDGEAYSQAILIYTSSEKYGPEEARWFRVPVNEQLLAADVKGGHRL